MDATLLLPMQMHLVRMVHAMEKARRHFLRPKIAIDLETTPQVLRIEYGRATELADRSGGTFSVEALVHSEICVATLKAWVAFGVPYLTRDMRFDEYRVVYLDLTSKLFAYFRFLGGAMDQKTHRFAEHVVGKVLTKPWVLRFKHQLVMPPDYFHAFLPAAASRFLAVTCRASTAVRDAIAEAEASVPADNFVERMVALAVETDRPRTMPHVLYQRRRRDSAAAEPAAAATARDERVRFLFYCARTEHIRRQAQIRCRAELVRMLALCSRATLVYNERTASNDEVPRASLHDVAADSGDRDGFGIALCVVHRLMKHETFAASNALLSLVLQCLVTAEPDLYWRNELVTEVDRPPLYFTWLFERR